MAKNMVEEISEKEFNKIINNSKNSIVLIDFFAEWCTPCLMMAPVIEELSGKFKKVKFAKVNIDENSELAGRFKVMSIPCLIVFKNGKEIDRVIGAQQAEMIEEKLEKYLS